MIFALFWNPHFPKNFLKKKIGFLNISTQILSLETTKNTWECMISWRVSMILVRNGSVSSNMEIRLPRCERTSWISSNGKIILAFCTFLSERAQIYNSFPKILTSKTLDFIELDISSWNAAKMSEKMERKNEFIACTWLGRRFAICG